MEFIFITDYLLLPLYLVLIYLIAYSYRNRRYPHGHPWRRYFIPGLTVKIFGAVFIGLLYQYYYHGGDTANYFGQGKMINTAFTESPVKWLNLLFRIPAWFDADYSAYISQLMWYDSANNYAVCSIAAIVNIFTFNTFLPTSVVFAALSFTGTWALFRTFAAQYPHLVRPVAFAVLFIPSTFVWGSGIFKDTVCMFGLGWMTYGVFQILIQREFSLKTIFFVLISFWIIAVIKIYILMAFLPAIALWILFTYSHRIRIGFIRVFLKFAFVGASVFGFLYFSETFAQELGSYSLDKLAETSTVTREYILSVSGDEGSGYSLGEIDPSIQGMLTKMPLAVNVALFRPYIWEARKIIILINAIESFLLLFLTLKVLFRVGPGKVWGSISRNPNVQFCLIFTLIFAFAVGISSYNFGSLSRYRIPCLPMYAMALVLIYYDNNASDRKLLPFM